MANCRIAGFAQAVSVRFGRWRCSHPLPRGLIEMKPAVLLAATLATLGALAATPAGAAGTTPAFQPDLARGQAQAATCLACHTADGSRGTPANPILQGQHPEYLVKQLTEYTSGRRVNAIMQGMAAILSDEDKRHVAAFYASKAPVLGYSQQKDLVELGQSIWRGGIAAKGVPACAACHGPVGAGIPAQYPRLGGQHYEYTLATMLAFRSGERANNAQMMTIAAKMNDREIQAVSDYIAGLR
jgi:cytochrome c553